MDAAHPFSDARFFTHAHLPIAAAYCRALDLQGIVDRMVPTGMALSAGLAVQAMVLDVLSGRSPLYRVEQFWELQDRALLLGSSVPSHVFNDTNLARALDALFEAGPSKIITELGIRAARTFGLDMGAVSYDTTSTSVWGEYRCSDREPEEKGPRIVRGHSKDGHPELKQFMTGLLCVERGVPIFGATLDGNSSDKRSNNAMLTRIGSLMARHGLGSGAFVYVADSAMVTLDNLSVLGGNRFVSRLPGTFEACPQAIDRAVAQGQWLPIGSLAELESPRPAAVYKGCETSVDLGGTAYRAVVVHSNAHDKRRQKAIDRELAKSLKEITDAVGQTQCRYFCERDARCASEALCRTETALHAIRATVCEVVVNKRGRPPKQGPRATDVRYDLQWEIVVRDDKLQQLRERAGCFVLVTNVPSAGGDSLDATALLRTYNLSFRRFLTLNRTGLVS